MLGVWLMTVNIKKEKKMHRVRIICPSLWTHSKHMVWEFKMVKNPGLENSTLRVINQDGYLFYLHVAQESSKGPI